MPTLNYSLIDIPFNCRHTCWFCGEPSSTAIEFPDSSNVTASLAHPLLSLPACRECCSFKYPRHIRSVWVLRSHIKQTLITKYTKHLAVGENWTEEELKHSEFSGAILGGFGESAWQMYLIAKQRIAYEGWALSVDDQALEILDDTSNFEFNGTQYPSLDACIDFFVDGSGIDKELLTQLVEIVTPVRFSYALQIAKLNKRLTPTKRREIIDEITLQEIESQQIEHEQQTLLYVQSEIVDVEISGATAPAFAIQWVLSKQVNSLAELCKFEDDFFDDFAHLGGAAVFHSYHGLQLYLQAREDANWIEKHDPNQNAWSNSL
ncbi:hypothetical protein BIY21_08940 [Vibrio ponticus]|uniref:HNH endonuclease n=1 Tax=Vibrio ponticus TaxID=265668 RepID=A0ABX3FNV2_9VIBR|nr:hypothetical protein [Vibrio ponticus]OLQ94472.1 hypothetical protein BIY21_08940 [Vibrio ponticus]